MTQDNNDPLVERYCEAWADIKGGRERWINGTLKLAAVIAESRKQYPDHRAFSLWVDRHGLKEKVTKDDRTALIGIAGADQTAMRQELERSESTSWRMIWKNSAMHTLRSAAKGDNSRGKRASGHKQRQRAKRIPTVMQEPYQRLQDLVLTREQVDPDFKGTPLEFSTKYGHVPLRTKEQVEADKLHDEATKWLAQATPLYRSLEALPPPPPGVQVWRAKPAKEAKMQAWQDMLIRKAEELQPKGQGHGDESGGDRPRIDGQEDGVCGAAAAVGHA